MSQVMEITEGTKTSRWRKRLAALRVEQAYWRPHWVDIVENFQPRRGRYLRGEDVLQDNDGRKKGQKIINGRAQLALHTFAAGMQSGTTSPSRPWFLLGLPDEDRAEFGPVREWLHVVQQAMLRVFAMSNYYTSHHYGFYELGAFGTNAMIIDQDDKKVIRCRPLTIGEYCLTQNAEYRPESLYRQFMMTAGQIRDKFCKKGDPYAIKEGDLPESIRTALATHRYDARFQMVHVIEENDFVQAERYDARGMPWRSVYFPLQGGDQNAIFRDTGYHSQAFIAPRWNVNAVDTYGEAIAFDALGDIKMLYRLELDDLSAISKVGNPPMVGPTSLKGTGGTIVSGGTTWVDTNAGSQKFEPAYLVKPDIQAMEMKIERVERRINEYFAVDLFKAITEMEGQDKTAYEVARRHEERLIQLGPALERLQQEDLDPTIERVFAIMDKMGLLPPPPPDLPPGTPIKVQYISVLAQAQKMVGMQPIEQTVGLVTQMAQIFPEVVDKIDTDEVIDKYTILNGTPPEIIRSKQDLAKFRAQKQKMQQMQQAAQMAPAAKDGASAVNSLANAPMQGGQTSALDQMMKGMSGAPR